MRPPSPLPTRIWYQVDCLIYSSGAFVSIGTMVQTLTYNLRHLLCLISAAFMFALCRFAALYCLEFRTPLFFNLRDKTCNISTISKMNAWRIKVKKRGGKKEQGKKKRMDIVSSTGSGRTRIFIVTSLNRSRVSLSLHNERLC